VNKSYRRYAVCRTTSVVAYVRQTIVNSHPGYDIGSRLFPESKRLSSLPMAYRSLKNFLKTRPLFLSTHANRQKLENVAIANALQLEAARRHGGPFPL